jgi:oligosaccharide repeat unit polymerase
LASAIIGSGRNYLLFFFLTLLIIVLQGKNVLIKLVIMVISFFLVSIFFIFAFNKADPDSGIILGTLLSLSHYFSVPLYGLSVIMDNNNLGTFMLLSDGILNILNISHIPTPPMEYTPYPFITNVYTLFWPMYYDLGYLGIIVFGLFYGFIHMILYSMAKNGGVAFYLYCISLYPLFMSIFHDTYLSSIGLWVVASVALIFFRKKENINV